MARIGYILKVYPRFSETFIVTEILAREAHGEDQRIYALRPTTDTRFHPEIARVAAPVTWVPRPHKASEWWRQVTAIMADDDQLRAAFAHILPTLATLPADEVLQGIAMAQAVRRDQLTHLHAHFASLAGRVAWIASQLTGVPYTVTTHAKDIFHCDVDRQWLGRVLGGAHRVIAISRYNLEFLSREFPTAAPRISLLHNGLELSRFPMRRIDEVPRPSASASLSLVAVGRLVAKKGFDALIDAAAVLRDQGTSFTLRIAGEGELAEELRAQVERLGLGESVQLMGAQTQAEVRALLEDADVFVAPCRVGDDGNMDGLPTVLLEAMACGTPVVATAVTGIPEVVRNGKTGVLLPDENPEALARAIAAVGQDRAMADAMAVRARALIEEVFDSRNQAATLGRWESGTEPTGGWVA